MNKADLIPLVHGLALLSIIVLLGIVGAGRLVDRARLGEAPAGPRIAGWLTRLPALVGWFLMMLVILRGVLQVLQFTDPGTAPDTETLKIVLTEGSWGLGWMFELSASFCVMALSWLLGGKRAQRIAIGLLASIIVVAEAGMGHGVESVWQPLVLGRLITATHLFGAGIWIGTLIVMELAVVPSLVATDARKELASVISGFSPSARWGAALLIGSGIVMTWKYTGPLVEVPGTTWGKLLIIKLLILLPLLGLGWYNWKVVTPRLEQGDAPAMRSLKRAALVEVLLAIVIIGVTAVLVGQALPVNS